MQLRLSKRNIFKILLLGVLFVASGSLFTACNESTPPVIIPPDKPPQITLFEIINTTMHSGDTATINVGALDDVGIDSAVVDYGEPSNIVFKITPPMQQKHLSAGIQRQFGTVGFHTVSFTVYDTKGQTARDSIQVSVYPDTSAVPRTRYLPKR